MKKYISILCVAASLLLSLVATQADAQLAGRELVFYNELGGNTNILTDTVTNTATRFLTSQRSGGSATTTSIVVTVTELTGTSGGTLTLYGCNTGCTKTSTTAAAWVLVRQPDTQTGVTTITATDTAGSTPYAWNITGSPYTYYRVQYVGAGTGTQTFAAKLMSH
jgi:hypothetical protein